MQGIKGAFVVVAVIGMAAALSACKKERHEPMKLGASNASVEQPARD